MLISVTECDCLSHVLARSLFVKFKWCTEQVPWASPAFQARIGHRDHSGFVQTKLVGSVLCKIIPFRSETVLKSHSAKKRGEQSGIEPDGSAAFY